LRDAHVGARDRICKGWGGCRHTWHLCAGLEIGPKVDASERAYPHLLHFTDARPRPCPHRSLRRRLHSTRGRGVLSWGCVPRLPARVGRRSGARGRRGSTTDRLDTLDGPPAARAFELRWHNLVIVHRRARPLRPRHARSSRAAASHAACCAQWQMTSDGEAARRLDQGRDHGNGGGEARHRARDRLQIGPSKAGSCPARIRRANNYF
jgi:hypothetical protein